MTPTRTRRRLAGAVWTVGNLNRLMANADPSFRTLDVYALMDADTDEAKQFQTYRFYWLQLERHLVANYGSDLNAALVAELRPRKAYRSLSSSQFAGDTDGLTHLLHNSWSNELMLYAVDDDDPRLLTAVQWHNVYAYYATGMSALAWLLVRDGVAPSAHRGLLDGLAAQVGGGRLFPEPWNLHLLQSSPPRWGGFVAPPNECHNLSSVESVEPVDAIGKLLKTTRGKVLDGRCAKHRSRAGGRLPNGTKSRIDDALGPTTIFEFVWRSRTRANYGSPAMFFKGSLGNLDSCVSYVNALKIFSNATMLLFESFIGQRARSTLADAATEFIARDRSRRSDQLVGERLRQLGYLR